MYLNLLLITLIPIVIAIVMYVIKWKTKFYNFPYWTRQIIIGVLFGGLAIIGTEFGVPCNGATANVRDAAPLLAGLLFGGPAGIIAGVIGGVERFFAAYWGRGFLTQWACSLSTIIAGVYAAALRKYMFEDKRPSWGFALAIAIVMEVFHFTMVYVTNLNNAATINVIIKALALPMIIANGVAVAVPAGVIQIITRNNNAKKEDRYKVSNQVKWWLLGSIILCYLISSGITYSVETNSAYSKADETFKLTIDDVESDVLEHSNQYMKGVLNTVMSAYNEDPYSPELSKPENANELAALRQRYHDLAAQLNVFSIDIIEKDADGKGVFVCSSDLGFQMDTFWMTMFPGQSFEIHTHMLDGDVYFIQQFGKRSDENNDGVKYLKYAAAQIDENYYLITAISETQFRSMINEKVSAITSYRHVNTSGHILILDDENNVVSDENEFVEKESGLTIKKLSKQGKEYKRLRGEVYGEDSFYMYTVAETYTIVVILPYEDVMSDRDSSFMLNSFMEILTFAALYVLIYFLLQRLVVKKIEIVNNDLSMITSGNLDTKVNVTSCLEFTQLSNDINETVDTLKKYIDEAAKRIDEELSFAKTIQTSSLPSTFPAFPDKNQFDIYATMNTAKEVGGDFYDFYIVDNNTLAFLIADVSGKGIPAAMFMMESKATIKNLAKTLLSPDEIIGRANDALAQNNDATMFVTCWFGLLNFKTGHVKFANAGHNSPLIYRKDKGYEYIKQKRNIVLAAMEGMNFALEEFDLNPGDKLFLYTDGVTEATRTDGVLYGEERLQTYLNSHQNESLVDTLAGVQVDIDKFIDGADQFDDITMLTIEYKG